MKLNTAYIKNISPLTTNDLGKTEYIRNGSTLKKTRNPSSKETRYTVPYLEDYCCIDDVKDKQIKLIKIPEGYKASLIGKSLILNLLYFTEDNSYIFYFSRKGKNKDIPLINKDSMNNFNASSLWFSHAYKEWEDSLSRVKPDYIDIKERFVSEVQIAMLSE